MVRKKCKLCYCYCTFIDKLKKCVVYTVMEYSSAVPFVLEYYSTTTLGVFVLATSGTRLVATCSRRSVVLGTRSKKAPSTRVRLAFVRR